MTEVLCLDEAIFSEHEDVLDVFNVRIDNNTDVAPLLDGAEQVHILLRTQGPLEVVQLLPVHPCVVIEEVKFFYEYQVSTLNVAVNDSGEGDQLLEVAIFSCETVAHS